MLWLDELRANDPEFTALLRERWAVLDGILEEAVKDGGVIDRMAEEIKVSWQADADKWGEWIASIKPLTDLETEVRDLKSFISFRRELIRDSLDQLSKVYYSVSFRAEGAEIPSVRLRIGQSLNTLPEAPEKEGFAFLGRADETGELPETVSGLFQPLRVCRRADAVTFVFRAAAQE